MESLFPRTVIFKNVVPKSAASVLPENLLEMKFTGPIPELLSQDLWGEKPRNLCFNQPLQVILMHDQCENHWGQGAINRLQEPSLKNAPTRTDQNC